MLSIFLSHRWNVSSVRRNKRCRIFCPVKQSMLGIFLSQIKPSWLTGRYKPISHHIFFSLQSKPFPSEGENVCDSAVAQGGAGKDSLEWGARMKSAIMEKGVREKSQKTGVIVSSTLAAVALDKTPLFCVTLEVSHTGGCLPSPAVLIVPSWTENKTRTEEGPTDQLQFVSTV